MNKPRKRSLAMSLVLIGATTTGCSMEDSRPVQRDVYNSFAECKADWGDDGDACEPNVEAVAGTNTTGTTSTTGSGYAYRPVYYGPSYYPGSRPTSILTNRGNHSVGNGARESRTVSSGSARSSGSSHASQGGRVSRGGFGGSSASRGASS